jgi:hypothetical protein
MPFRAPTGVAVLLTAAGRGQVHVQFPHAGQFASTDILNPPDMLQTFTQYALEPLKAASHGA